MLMTEPLFVELGVPVFADHADPALFWYLPARVSLAQRNGYPVFSFIKYRDPLGQGGGLLSFEVNLGLSDKLRNRITDKLGGKAPRLVQVPFVDGSVQCVTLDAGADASRSGAAPRLVNQVLGAAHPSLQGDNSAIFTLALGPEGAEVAEAAMKGGASILGVIYQLDYTAMQPPLQVKVTAKMEQIYRFLGASVTAQYKFLRADLSAAIERMRADKNLIIERIDTVGTEASAKELDSAAKIFTDQLLRDWFTPLLIPGSPRTQMVPNLPYNPNMQYNPNAPFGAVGANPFGMAGSGYGLGIGNGAINPLNDPFAAPGGSDPFNPGGNPLAPGGDPFNPGAGPLAPAGDPFNPGLDPSASGLDPFNPGAAPLRRSLLRSSGIAGVTPTLRDAPGDPAPDAPPATPAAPADPIATPATPESPGTAIAPAPDGRADDAGAVDGAPQGVDLLADGAAGAASAAGGAASAAAAVATRLLPLPQVTLQLKAIDQKELREFHAEYNSRQAVKRTYRPQGFFGLNAALLAQLPASAFMEIDTDSQFWRLLEVTMHGPAPADYAALGLTSAVARIQYGTTLPVDKSFQFAPQDEAAPPQRFAAPMRRGELDYQPILTYAFDASWTGDPTPRELRLARSDLRELYLAPHRDFRFVVINACFTDVPDWTQLAQIQLSIRAWSGPDGERFEKNVVVRPDWVPGFGAADSGAALPWRLRFRRTGADADADAITIDSMLTWYYKDGRTVRGARLKADNADLVLPPGP